MFNLFVVNILTFSRISKIKNAEVKIFVTVVYKNYTKKKVANTDKYSVISGDTV